MSNKTEKETRARFRREVFTRAGYTCEVCYKPGYCCQIGCGHKHGVPLDAHHITPCKEYEDGGYHISNGISLCHECHIEAEKYDEGRLPPALLRGLIE